MRFILILVILLGLSCPMIANEAEAYRQKIKPLLKERCYACHGALKQRGKLRVDTVAFMHKSQVLDGELLARLLSEDPDERMPPEGEPLDAEEIEEIRAWIASGAPAPKGEVAEDDPREHWSFQRIERPDVPSGNAKNPIDAFLEAKLTANGLLVQKRAERTVLLRRLYLDVIGLPPTPEQLASKAAYEKIVDKLLASPHYGERWGRHWMDVWRYSDSYGLNAQLRYSQKHLWHWRDWIVNSLNEDKGYDEMVREMLAGDELAPGNPDVVAATGFLARNYYLFNRTTWLDSTIEHTGKAFLGLTMDCAKCHDHKYDPISQEDYYRFRAIFEPHQIRLDAVPGETDFSKNGIPRAFDDDLDAQTFFHDRGNPQTPDKTKKIIPGVPAIFSAFEAEARPVKLPVSAWAPGARAHVQGDQLAAAVAKLNRARETWEKASLKENRKSSISTPPLEGITFRDEFEENVETRWMIEGNGWRYQGGALVQLEATRDKQYARSKQPHPTDFDLTLRFRTTGGETYKSVGIRFDVADDGKEAHTVYVSAHAPAPKVQIAHTQSGVTSYPANGRSAQPITLDQDYELRVQARGRLLNVSLDGERILAYTLPHRNPLGRLELFAFDAIAEFDFLSLAALHQDAELEPSKGASAEPADRVDEKELAGAELTAAESGLEALRARIACDNALLKGEGKANPAEAYRLEKKHAVALARVGVIKAEAGKLKAAKKSLATAEKALREADGKTDYAPLRGSQKALETPEHKETDYPATYPKESTGRRTALANWITHRENPLAARVAANQIWMRHFGKPLVESVFDFGRQAPKPLHAELLDFLAVELMDSGWSMKHLHRLILTSEAWQRSSSNLGADSATFVADPENHYYWRADSKRMESQLIRDSLLHLAGELDLTRGGPSVDPKPSARRRSLYFKHSRDDQSLFLSTFNDAEILACYRRSESIVPQQALALTNSKISFEMSRAIAGHFGAEKEPDAFVAAAFRTVLCRVPTAEERDLCLTFLKEEPDRSRFIHALINHNDFITIR